ncbi:unnamed protein product [Durusdinium trenchii]|uniref:Uncharacterized protein n=2 Tax=Durusdinium trenchii TaxID=1381693 RepID=A0ABP0MRU4_9DINO
MTDQSTKAAGRFASAASVASAASTSYKDDHVSKDSPAKTHKDGDQVRGHRHRKSLPNFQCRAEELLKKKMEELYVLIPKMVDLFEGIDDTKTELLVDQLVEMVEVSTDLLLTESMKNYGQLQCIKLQVDALVDSLAWLKEELDLLVTSFESCLKGRKIRVSDDEFKEMVDLVDLDHLLAQVEKHQRRQVVEKVVKVPPLESTTHTATREVETEPRRQVNVESIEQVTDVNVKPIEVVQVRIHEAAQSQAAAVLVIGRLPDHFRPRAPPAARAVGLLDEVPHSQADPQSATVPSVHQAAL